MSKRSLGSNKVFIVHGRDVAVKAEVARFIGKLGFAEIIFHESAGRGRTLIEKLEDFVADGIDFVVVLLTPDDVGALSSDKDVLQSRARQNVIFELGFFIGILGRERVCALLKDNVELPSDYDGVIWVHFDSRGAWRTDLAREMKAAGLAVDMNRL